jgi:transcription factor SFP1
MPDPNKTTAKQQQDRMPTQSRGPNPLSHGHSTPTPPPPELDYRQESRSTSNTPVSTPLTDNEPWPPSSITQSRKERDKDLYFSWHKKPTVPANPNRRSNPLFGVDWHFTPTSEEALFEDGENSLTPLFPDDEDDSARVPTLNTMASALPIDISLPPRLNSQSPRNHTSNLTFALQEAGASAQPAQEAPNEDPRNITGDPARLGFGARNDSITNMFGGSSYYGGSGARPISVKDRNRRESNTAGSFMGGMSWGGMSVGSFIRDE